MDAAEADPPPVRRRTLPSTALPPTALGAAHAGPGHRYGPRTTRRHEHRTPGGPGTRHHGRQLVPAERAPGGHARGDARPQPRRPGRPRHRPRFRAGGADLPARVGAQPRAGRPRRRRARAELLGPAAGAPAARGRGNGQRSTLRPRRRRAHERGLVPPRHTSRGRARRHLAEPTHDTQRAGGPDAATRGRGVDGGRLPPRGGRSGQGRPVDGPRPVQRRRAGTGRRQGAGGHRVPQARAPGVRGRRPARGDRREAGPHRVARQPLGCRAAPHHAATRVRHRSPARHRRARRGELPAVARPVRGGDRPARTVEGHVGRSPRPAHGRAALGVPVVAALAPRPPARSPGGPETDRLVHRPAARHGRSRTRRGAE